MKALIYFFVMAVIVIAGCAKDDTMFETQDNLELKKAKVPVPFKADLYMVLDLNSELMEVPLPGGGIFYAKTGGILSGTCSHMGKIDAEKSYCYFKNMVFMLDEQGNPCSEQTGTGIIVGANGDSMETTWWNRQSWVDGSYIGTIDITKGTGKFEGCSGSGTTVGGWHDDGVGIWQKSEGYLVYE
ncbi:MAG: hypothetical protein K0B11_16770 [Mariniphaga sp.]|nr:hypothetical protein [Mariniphaga sp.]